jgi:predicted dehydrogenase
VPDTLSWDLWLGVAADRPYKEETYHPFVWRGWEDFGTGAQGDMACHLMDPAFWFLGLAGPTRIRSEGPPPNGETYPLWSTVHYEFPPNEHTTRGPLLFTWYDGGRSAPRQLLADLGVQDPPAAKAESDEATHDSSNEAAQAEPAVKPTVVPSNGCLFVGTEGALLADPYAPPQLLPAEKFANVEIPTVEGVNHWHQWVDACRGEGVASAPFEYAAHLTEIALLGNVALRFPHETLEWNAKRMRFTNRPAANPHLYSKPREGWG